MNLLSKIDHYSPSSISAWEICPRNWWANYVLGKKMEASEAASFGSQFDQLVSQRIGCPVGKQDKLPDEWLDGVEQAVDLYLCQPWALKSATVAQKAVRINPAEWAMMAEMHGLFSEIRKPIIGFADLIDDQQRLVVDLKTSGRKDARQEWAGQLIFYALAEQLSSAEVHLLTRTKTPAVYRFTIPVNDETKKWALIRFSTAIEQIERALENGAGEELVRNPGWKCGYCPEQFECPAFNMIREV